MSLSSQWCLIDYVLPLRRGLERVFILDFYVNVARDMWNLGFKGLLHILLNPILLIFFILVSHSIFL